LLLSTGKLLRPAGFEALQPEAVSSLFGTSDDFIPRKFPDARRKGDVFSDGHVRPKGKTRKTMPKLRISAGMSNILSVTARLQ
jgi:hypothetical protein